MTETRLSVLVVDGSGAGSIEFERLVAERCPALDVMVVRSVGAARNLLGASHFDAVLSSAVLSDGSVLDVLGVDASIPVIVLSTEGEENLVARAMASGAAAHLTRDSRHRFLETLAAVIDSAVRHGVAQDELRRHKEQLEEAVEQRTEILRTEIADRRRAETEKALMLDSTSDLVVYHDPDMKVLWANSEAGASVGQGPERLVGLYCWEIWHGRDTACEGCPVILARDTGEAQRAEIRSPDGKWWNIRGYPVKDSGGKVVGVTEFCLDITDAKQAEEELGRHREHLEDLVEERTAELCDSNRELRAANWALESFSHSVSHDLRAPLRAVGGYSQILLEDHSDALDADARQMLETMCSKTRRMGKLVEDLLWFSRAGRRDLRRSGVDMNALASEVIGDLQEQAVTGSARLAVEQLPPAVGDASMLRRVLSNLVGNAVELTRHEQRAFIEVGSRVENEEVVYFVRNNGVGFDQRRASALLQVFERPDGAERFEGAGEGLTIVQHIVQRHGGRVWAEGEIDHGATFCFSLPSV